MEDSALSVDVEHDFLPEFNDMFPLPAGDEDHYDDEDRRIALTTRLRLWRSGPADGPTLRAAVEAEVANDIEHGMLGEDDRTLRIDSVMELLSGDDSIADPPDADDVGLALGRNRELFANWYGPGRQDLVGGKRPPDALPDRYGNWPGENWRQAVEYALRKVSDRPPLRQERDEQGRKRVLPPTTSDKIAMLWLRREKTDQAAAVAAAEEQGRSDAGRAAVEALPIVFDDERQNLLRFLARFHARGELTVPVSGDPLAEAQLMAELKRNWDAIGLADAGLADVVAALMRFVVSRQTVMSQQTGMIVPSVGYEIVVELGKIVDVLLGHLTLTIEGREHVLNSPELPRPVRMTAKQFRDPRLCALAIYEQTLVEVDLPRGHWRRWWPVLASMLSKTAVLIEDAQRGMEWERFKAGVTAGAVESPSALTDGAPYRCSRGTFVGKEWLARKAVEAGVISESEKRTFMAWLPEAKPEYDDTGKRHKRLRLAGPLCIEGSFEPVEKIAVRGTEDTNDA